VKIFGIPCSSISHCTSEPHLIQHKKTTKTEKSEGTDLHQPSTCHPKTKSPKPLNPQPSHTLKHGVVSRRPLFSLASPDNSRSLMYLINSITLPTDPPCNIHNCIALPSLSHTAHGLPASPTLQHISQPVLVQNRRCRIDSCVVGIVSAAGESPARDGKFWGEDGTAVWCEGMGSGSGDGGCRRECSGLWRGVCVREEGMGPHSVR
jgi:hypothetical protein